MTTAPVDTRATQLARFTVGLGIEDLPVAVVERAKLCVLDQLGVQVMGASLPIAQIARAHVVASGPGRPESTLVVNGAKVAAPLAAYANAVFGHSCELDDAHERGGHPSVCVVPPALALAEATGATGADLVAAVVAGYEVVVRSLSEVHREILNRGWHSTKVAGGFGAAAASARLLGLGEAETAHAFGITGSDCSGTHEYDQSGGEVKRFHPAMAARSGMEAAIMASGGLTGPPAIFEGRRGVMRLFGGSVEMAPDWGTRYEILNGMFKRYPTVGTLHAPLDALGELLAEQPGITPSDVAGISVQMAEWAIPHGAAIVAPTQLVEAQFSLAFSLALLLVRGRVELAGFREAANWSDPEIMAIANQVTVTPLELGPDDTILAATVTLHRTDGSSSTRHVPAFRGHQRFPLTPDELTTKFLGLAGPTLGGAATAVVEMVSRLDQVGDISELVSVLCV